MEIILEVTGLETREDIEDLQKFVLSMRSRIEQRQWQDFPGLYQEYGDGAVWIKGVRLDA